MTKRKPTPAPPDDIANRTTTTAGMRLCGARLSTTRNPRHIGTCKRPALESGRCAHHGGASTGAPLGNTSNLKHGFYYDKLLPEEQAEWPAAIAQGAGPIALEQELALVRVKIKRLLAASGRPALAAQIENHVDLLLRTGKNMAGALGSKSEMRRVAIAELQHVTLQLRDRQRAESPRRSSASTTPLRHPR